MPVDDSRLPGFYKLSVAERRSRIANLANLSEEEVSALATHGELDELAADRMIENVIGTMSLPVGIATNFVIDGKPYLFRSASKNQALSLQLAIWRKDASQKVVSQQIMTIR